MVPWWGLFAVQPYGYQMLGRSGIWPSSVFHFANSTFCQILEVHTAISLFCQVHFSCFCQLHLVLPNCGPFPLWQLHLVLPNCELFPLWQLLFDKLGAKLEGSHLPNSILKSILSSGWHSQVVSPHCYFVKNS